MGPGAIFAAKTLPRLDCPVQMAGSLSGSLVRLLAPNRQRDETDEHFGPTSDQQNSGLECVREIHLIADHPGALDLAVNFSRG